MSRLETPSAVFLKLMTVLGLIAPLSNWAQQSPTCTVQFTGSGNYAFSYAWGAKTFSSSGTLSATPTTLSNSCGSLKFSSGIYSWQPTIDSSVQFLLAGGGGAGGQSWGGGGGAGGFLSGSYAASAAQSYAFTVGAGGVGVVSGYAELGTSGGDTTGFGLTAYGGGGGGGGNANSNNSGSAGGSGGGAGVYVTGGGTLSVNGSPGTSGQGHAGGNQIRGSNPWSIAGGGGGAGSAGVDGLGTTGGTGGAGVLSSLSGSSVYYCAGGGGGGYSTYCIPFGYGGSNGSGTGGGNGGGNGGPDQFQVGFDALSICSGGGGGSGNMGLGGSGKEGVVVLSYVNNAIFGSKANNTFLGSSSGLVNTGAANTFVGSHSGQFDSNGVDNIYVGALSGTNASSANLFNGLIALGANAAVPVSILNNAINLGANTTAQTGKMVIGDANLVHLHVGGVASWVTPSDGRLKDNIRASTWGLEFVRQLKPKAYTMKASGDARLGFIAQDVEALAPNFQGLVKPQTQDDYYALNDEAFIAPLAQSIQTLDASLKALELSGPASMGVDTWMQSQDRHVRWAFQIMEALMALNVLVFVLLQFKCWCKLMNV